MPLGNLIEEVHQLRDHSTQLITDLPEISLPNDFCREFERFMNRHFRNSSCRKYSFRAKSRTKPLWAVCSNQYLVLASIAHNFALCLKNYFDFLDAQIRPFPDLVRIIADLQTDFKRATENDLERINHRLIERNCTAYINHCRDFPEDRDSLCYFLAGIGVKGFKNERGERVSFRGTGDLFGAYIPSIEPMITNASGFLGDLVYALAQEPEFYNRLLLIVNQNNATIQASSPLQLILFGAPGTGKSFKIDDPENGYGLKDVDEEFKFRTTFHPDYDYAQFVGAYKPVKTTKKQIGLNRDDLLLRLNQMQLLGETYPVQKFGSIYYESLEKLSTQEKISLIRDANFDDSMRTAELPKGIAIGKFIDCEKHYSSSITYSFTPQVFAKAYVKAWTECLKVRNQNPETPVQNVYLVIEEINRGNCAQIFGDIFQLLDRENGHSAYPIDVDLDFAEYIKEQLSNIKIAENQVISCWEDYKTKIQEWSSENGQGNNGHCDDFCKIALPPNLNILATMNTSDQSLFPMDSAFKRRFDWEYVPINDKHKKAHFAIDVDGTLYDWRDFLAKVNKNISDVTKSEDKQLGEFFIKPKQETETEIKFDDFRSKVMFYLWDSIYKDEEGNQIAEKVFHFKIAEGSDDKMTFQRLFDKNLEDGVEKGIRYVKMILGRDHLDVKPFDPAEDDNERHEENQDQENVVPEDAGDIGDDD